MKRLDLLEGNEYIVVNAYSVYPDFVGDARWFIVSKLSENELKRKYEKEIAKYEPWIFVTLEQYTVMVEWKRNEDRSRRRFYGQKGTGRKGKLISYGIDDDYIEKLLQENIEANCYYWIPEIEEELEAFSVLTSVQANRIQKYVFDQMTIREIAAKEGRQYTAVRKSIVQGITKLRNYYLMKQ